jgi:hypothetical protein
MQERAFGVVMLGAGPDGKGGIPSHLPAKRCFSAQKSSLGLYFFSCVRKSLCYTYYPICRLNEKE